MNSLDDKVLQTLSELENGTEKFVTEDELNTLLANYPTNEELTEQLDGKANVGDVTPSEPTEIPGLDAIIKEKVDEAVANASLQRFAFTDNDGYIPRIDSPDLHTMSGIESSGFYYAYNPVNSPDLIIKVVTYSLCQEVLAIRKYCSYHSTDTEFTHVI